MKPTDAPVSVMPTERPSMVVLPTPVPTRTPTLEPTKDKIDPEEFDCKDFPFLPECIELCVPEKTQPGCDDCSTYPLLPHCTDCSATPNLPFRQD